MSTHVAAIFEIQLRGCEGPPVLQVENPMLRGGRVPVRKSSITQPLTLPNYNQPPKHNPHVQKNPQKSTHTSPKVLAMLNPVS